MVSNPKQHLETITAIALRECEAKAKSELPVIERVLAKRELDVNELLHDGNYAIFRDALIWAMLNAGWTNRTIAHVFNLNLGRVCTFALEARSAFSRRPPVHVVNLASELRGAILDVFRKARHELPCLCCGDRDVKLALRIALQRIAFETGIPTNALLAFPHQQQIRNARRAVIWIARKISGASMPRISEALHVRRDMIRRSLTATTHRITVQPKYGEMLNLITDQCADEYTKIRFHTEEVAA